MDGALEQVRFAFQPVFNLRTGGAVAIEVLARTPSGSAQAFLESARREGRLAEVDVRLAAAAVRSAADFETLMPLHLNLRASTVAASPVELAPLREVLNRTSRRPRDVVIDISAPYSDISRDELLRGIGDLRLDGFGISLDGLGDGDSPLTVLADAAPDLLKLDRRVTAGLPGDHRLGALVESLVHFADRLDAGLLAEGVQTDAELAAIRRLGVGFAQGNLLAPAARRPVVGRSIAPATMVGRSPVGHDESGPPLKDFLHPAITLPADSTAEEVRVALADQPAATGIVLVDKADRPHLSIDRNRFLLAVTGPYGHALHARRAAARLGDKPHLVDDDASALTVLDVIAAADKQRAGDDVVVVDATGRCRGIVRVTELVRGIAEAGVGGRPGRHSR
jgi:EAL domain-containing protein (putative c-di-GMP-specific phosphodiesterase class I)